MKTLSRTDGSPWSWHYHKCGSSSRQFYVEVYQDDLMWKPEQLKAVKIEFLQEVKWAKIDETLKSYSNDPFIPHRLTFNILSSFKFPNVLYSSANNPKDLANCNNHMNTLDAPDAVKYRAFSMTLSHTAQAWYLSLPNGLVHYFD
ncbi:hypothetical protein PVK06_002685 [Gossypium arboreum]|uniref:Retrotransposon gag domain-containing protein n=1 Tax=Gossypium arboreum TaxID=29729 RepID=A0ABR0R4A8_GOSAR|nr:hypothetical protein PVK06_002685 [Gossypium arboreum]